MDHSGVEQGSDGEGVQGCGGGGQRQWGIQGQGEIRTEDNRGVMKAEWKSWGEGWGQMGQSDS